MLETFLSNMCCDKDELLKDNSQKNSYLYNYKY
jgi:hypothetical protein